MTNDFNARKPKFELRGNLAQSDSRYIPDQLGRYTADAHEGVTGTAMYWHFLGVAWLGILAVLLV